MNPRGSYAMTATISVFIPVYRESELLETTLERLVNDEYESKEIFVIIDEPTEGSLELSKKFQGNIHFILHEERVGKANALNEAVERSTGSILLFLDGDVTPPDDPRFLSKVANEMMDTDILDLKKEVVGDSLIAKIAYYEYLGFNVGSWLASKTLGRCPSINGAAFAIRREVFKELGGFRRVVSEDLDLATRAFLGGYRHKYTKNVFVYNRVHHSWNAWFRQRRRWALGLTLWLKDYYRELLSSVKRHFRIFIPTLILLFPSLVAIILSMFIPDFFIEKMLSFSLLLLATWMEPAFSIPILIPVWGEVDVIKGVFCSILAFSIFCMLFYYFSSKLGFKFRIHEFFLYYFFYSTLYLMIIISTVIRVLILHREVDVDWKV